MTNIEPDVQDSQNIENIVNLDIVDEKRKLKEKNKNLKDDAYFQQKFKIYLKNKEKKILEPREDIYLVDY